MRPSAIGDGTWFVRVRPEDVCVLAAPASSLVAGDRSFEADQGPQGWRIAQWPRRDGCWPRVDRDEPEALRAIDTCEVLELLGPQLREAVWVLMRDQLQIARGCGRGGVAPIGEEAARAGSLAARWLEHELAVAFPHRADELHDFAGLSARMYVSSVPDDLAGLELDERRVPTPARRAGDVPSERELEALLDEAARVGRELRLSLRRLLKIWVRARHPRAWSAAQTVVAPIRRQPPSEEPVRGETEDLAVVPS